MTPPPKETFESIENDRLDPLPNSWMILLILLGAVILVLLFLALVSI
jgi:hypothetical protein